MEEPYKNKDPSPGITVDDILEELRAKKNHPSAEEPRTGRDPPEPDLPKPFPPEREVSPELPEKATPESLVEKSDQPEETTPESSAKEPDSSTKQKKKKGLLWDIVFYVALLVLVLGILLVKSGGDGAPVSVAGFSLHNVLTASMQEEIPQGSLVITREVDAKTLQIGDDITYMRDEKTSVTHRIVGIIEEYEDTGQRAFETQGIMNRERDKLPVPAANVVGKVIFHNYALGQVMEFLSQYWYFLLLFLFLFSGLIWALKTVFSKDKNEPPEEEPKKQSRRRRNRKSAHHSESEESDVG